MRKEITACAIGTITSAVCTTAVFASASPSVSPGLETILSILGIAALPGVVVGMLFAGDAHVGGPEGIVFPIALVVNAGMYYLLSYAVLYFMKARES